MICKDIDMINGILARDDVKPIEMAQYIEHPDAVYILHNGCLFLGPKRDRLLSIHAGIPKDKRGKNAIIAAKEAIRWAFDNLDIDKIQGRIYKHRRHVQMFARLVGMRYAYSDERFDYFEAKR